MEDTARLALIEMYVNNEKGFESFLSELLQFINHILDNPHDKEFRVLKSEYLTTLLKCEDFCAYLKYIGFERETDSYVFPQEQTLSKLKSAQLAIEKKITYCYGPEKCSFASSTVNRSKNRKKICQFKPADVLDTTNPFLQSIQTLFNEVLKYENEELLELARSHIPMVRLQLRAFERMREYQKKIKTGEEKGEDMSYDTALLAELLGWFKHEFFTWVDRPPCARCGADTRFTGKTRRLVDGETCLVEEYACAACGGATPFPRHNEPRALLRTRRGRCGEYANCFMLMCRALGYETRYVHDDADHVWCEVFDYESDRWLHVDPCEARLDAPLMYYAGWGKRPAYVLAAARDDLQDVTWRYTCRHGEVLSRRARCSEPALVSALVRLRAHRHAQLSPPRRRHLAARALKELVELMVERKPEEYETQGRISGSLAWRRGRGEAGAAAHVFRLDRPGAHALRYYTSSDRYVVTSEGREPTEVASWEAGAFTCQHVFRKVETDWKQAYLARDEGESSGSISWKLECAGARAACVALSVRALAALYDSGRVDWSLKFDDREPESVKLSEETTQLRRRFKSVVLCAALSGGSGREAWQHAQLFRQPLDSAQPTLEIQVHVASDDDIDLD